MGLRSTVFLFTWLSFMMGGAAAALEPEISFAAKSVAVSGVTPGGKVVWFGVAREISEHTATLVRRDRIVSDDDRDGSVRLDLDRTVPLLSIWVAIDLTTGASAVATPEGFPLRRLELPSESIHRGGDGESDWVGDTRGFVEVQITRPGASGGAWGIAVGDGGESDDDGLYDGRLAASLAGLHAVESSPEAPQRFSAGDVVIVLDPNRMEISLRRLAEVPR
jgi:hypothetical protein